MTFISREYYKTGKIYRFGSVSVRFFSIFFGSVRFAAEEKKIGSVRFGFRDGKKFRFGSVRF